MVKMVMSAIMILAYGFVSLGLFLVTKPISLSLEEYLFGFPRLFTRKKPQFEKYTMMFIITINYENS